MRGYGIFYDSPQLFFDTRFSNAPPFGSDDLRLPESFLLTNPWSSYAGDSQTAAGQDPFPGINTQLTRGDIDVRQERDLCEHAA